MTIPTIHKGYVGRITCHLRFINTRYANKTIFFSINANAFSMKALVSRGKVYRAYALRVTEVFPYNLVFCDKNMNSKAMLKIPVLILAVLMWFQCTACAAYVVPGNTPPDEDRFYDKEVRI